MSSKRNRKESKKKSSQSILKCTNVTFEKKPKKDRKGAVLLITYETASGSWTSKKVFDETWKFMESTAKSHKKVIGKYASNASKYKDEYLNKSKHENAFKMIKDIINGVGKNKKILSNDSKITAFAGAKRDFLKDIKGAKVIGSASTKTKRVSISNSMLPLGNDSNNDDAHKEQKQNKDDNVTDEVEEKENDIIQQQKKEVELSNKQKEEISKLKRAHLSEISALKQENHNLKMNNAQLRETNEATQETRAELEAKIAAYEQELGKDQIGDEMASIFAEEFKKVLLSAVIVLVEDPGLCVYAEKYYQQTKEQKVRINELEAQVTELIHSNGDLKTKLERAKYVADHLATEVSELANPQYEQLEQDYKEVEAELDELTQVKERYEVEMAQTAKILDDLELETAKMRPHFEEYPNLVKQIEQQREDSKAMHEKLVKLQEENEKYEDKCMKYAEMQKDSISKDEHKKSIKRYQEQIKDLEAASSLKENEKNEAVKELETMKQSVAEMKIKVGQLEAANDKLEKGGGLNINLDLTLDLENDFSIFKKDEFEFPANLSRNQLLLFVDHFKTLIKEMNEELCEEINELSERNEILSNYIELKGLPFPEDDNEFNKNKSEMEKVLSINDLPHPLPSMNFMDDLEEFNPTKQQLKDYIDLMFAEWQRDEDDANNMILATLQDEKLLNELEENVVGAIADESASEEDEAVEKLKKQLEAAYLKQEEKELEFKQSIKELGNKQKEEISKLKRAHIAEITALKSDREENPKDVDPPMKNPEDADLLSIEEDDHEEPETDEEANDIHKELLLVKKRLADTEQYVKELQDNLKQLEFETAQQKQALEREYNHQIDLINIDLEESRNRCEDLLRQIGSDDLNLLATEFRNELWDARNDNNELKKKHIEEIMQLEKEKDEVLREINSLRIKTERMGQDEYEAVAKMEIELDKKEKELEHFIQVTSDLTHFKENAVSLLADRDELNRSYQELQSKHEKEATEKQQEINQLNIDKKKLIIKVQTAEHDIKSLKQASGIDSDAIITRTELVKMKEQMDELKFSKTEAIKSKIRLLQTSSLEIERMRDEIKLLTGNRKMSKRDFKPGRYDSTSYNVQHRESIRSVSSLGSIVPFGGNTHQQLLANDADHEESQSYLGSAWAYTVGMMSSVGAMFGGAGTENESQPQKLRKKHFNEQQQRMMMMNNMHDDEIYDIHTDYPYDNHSQRSSLSNASNYKNNGNVYGGYDRHSRHMSGSMALRNKHYAAQPSMAGSYADAQIHHNRGLSAAAVRAKQNRRNKYHPRHRSKNYSNMSTNSLYGHQRKWSNMSSTQQHQRKASRHRTQSNMSMLSQSHDMRGVHRSKQPSKQEILLESTDNENIRDSMAKIFDAFDEAQVNVDTNMSSQDLSANNGFSMFSLNEMDQTTIHENEEHDDDAGNNIMNVDAFWNSNMLDQNQGANENLDVQYSDDDNNHQYVDFAGNRDLQSL